MAFEVARLCVAPHCPCHSAQGPLPQALSLKDCLFCEKLPTLSTGYCTLCLCVSPHPASLHALPWGSNKPGMATPFGAMLWLRPGVLGSVCSTLNLRGAKISQDSWLLTLASWSLREDFRVQRSPETMWLSCWSLTTSGKFCQLAVLLYLTKPELCADIFLETSAQEVGERRGKNEGVGQQRKERMRDKEERRRRERGP